MKKLLIASLSAALLMSCAVVNAKGYAVCHPYDTFCKSPLQLVATKCRLGVPVLREQCAALGVPWRYSMNQLVEGLPVTVIDGDYSSTMDVLQPMLAETTAEEKIRQ